MMYEGMEM